MVGLLLFFYEMMSRTSDNPLILPGLMRISKHLIHLPLLDVLLAVSTTIIRTLSSYIISIIVALMFAVIANIKEFDKVIKPIIGFFRTIPTISVMIIILIWFKQQQAMFIIGFLIVLPILFEVFYHSIKNVDPQLKEVSKVYRFSKVKQIKYIYYYSIIENFFMSLKQSFGLAFKVMVMSEVIGQARHGIGAEINASRINIEMEGVIIWTVILIVIVLLLERMLKQVSKLIIKWK